MTALYVLAMAALTASVMVPEGVQAQDAKTPQLVHSQTEFHFTVQAGYERVFPLFGALEEKKWAEGWEPRFVYPASASDQRGMVFTTDHAGRTSTWVCTAFDETTGHVQYVYVVNGLVATQIDIHVTKTRPKETRVSVVYERTALSAAANEHVSQMAKSDADSGREWGEAINGYLARSARDAGK